MREAVAVLDLAAYSDLVSIAEVRTAAEALLGWTGIPQARRALDLADENAWSPTEVSLRLLWVIDAGLPHPLTNRPVFNRHGRHVGTPDLLDVAAGLTGEYDGAAHLSGRQRTDDLRRLDGLQGVGLTQLIVVAGDLGATERVVSRIHQTRRRSSWDPPDVRQWTTELPHWWVDTSTVARRRALSARDRERWLGYRAA